MDQPQSQKQFIAHSPQQLPQKLDLPQENPEEGGGGGGRPNSSENRVRSVFQSLEITLGGRVRKWFANLQKDDSK